MDKVVRKLWHRKQDESDAQFAGFSLYLNLGKGRSLLEAYRRYSGKEKATQPGGTFQSWSVLNSWLDRVNAYDAWQGQVEDTKFEHAAAKEQSKLAKRRAEANSVAWDMAKLLIEKAKMILKVPILEQQIESEERDKDGRLIKVIKIIKPAKFKVADAARMVEIADRLARLATDMSTDNVSFNLNEQLKRVSEETGVPLHVLEEEYRQMTGKHPPKLLH